MNYFQFYNLPESFLPDEKAIKTKYYELSRQYHPDFHATASPEKQQEILQLSTQKTNASTNSAIWAIEASFRWQRGLDLSKIWGVVLRLGCKLR